MPLQDRARMAARTIINTASTSTVFPIIFVTPGRTTR